MASSVFYKFNSRKDESRVSFDGTGIAVFDLKREIILANNMGKANDFDLFIYDATSKQGESPCPVLSRKATEVTCPPEFKDDSIIIPRSSSVIVKRLPSSRPGKGKAAMYISGGSGPSIPTSEPVIRAGTTTATSTWHKGAMSKRFDVKDESTSNTSTKASTPVR